MWYCCFFTIMNEIRFFDSEDIGDFEEGYGDFENILKFSDALNHSANKMFYKIWEEIFTISNNKFEVLTREIWRRKFECIEIS